LPSALGLFDFSVILWGLAGCNVTYQLGKLYRIAGALWVFLWHDYILQGGP